MNVLVVDDHKETRKALADLIDREEDLQVVGTAADGQAAIDHVEKQQPDIVIMDLAMPGVNGMVATDIIHNAYPLIHVVVLSNHVGKHLVQAALNRGASGYIRKDRAHEELITGIRTVSQGRIFIGEAVA
jgi:DNA-binding NarL/FixJ family response regulator